MKQIKLSIQLHKAPLVILMLHMDCGGYGGSATFRNDPEVEFAHHTEALKKAKDFLVAEIPGLAVETYVASFAGFVQVNKV